MIVREHTVGAEPSWFGFALTRRDAAQRRSVKLLAYLDRSKIGARLPFAGNLTRQPSTGGWQHRVSGDLANIDRIRNHTFWVSVCPGLNDEMLDFVASKI